MAETMVDMMVAWCKAFGGEPGRDYIKRSNISANAMSEGAAFYGVISPDETESGPYHDLSYVVFPASGSDAWLVALGVGSAGFRNDFDLAASPGMRRRFLRLVDENGFIKSDFTDIETTPGGAFMSRISHLGKVPQRYGKLLPACQIIEDPNAPDGEAKLKAFLALYADMRGWPTNAGHRKAVAQAIEDGSTLEATIDELQQTKALLLERKYMVLQGAPGTGKTRLAKKLAAALDAKVFFTQFHAETTYADFVWGIRPTLSQHALGYQAQVGPLVQAIEYAGAHPTQHTVLIIDEINRANLSNVLGQVFYLFEYQMQDDRTQIEIMPGQHISRLPSNLLVVATMNTADRSLAVVDFALRRRFAWYTLIPHEVNPDAGLLFMTDTFRKMLTIFETHAKDEELALMPGQGYFIVAQPEDMENRLRYELMPLIKEYLSEGLLTAAKDDFVNYFRQAIGEEMFR